MPYIRTTTNVTITPEQAESLKAKFGKAIESFPGKSEAWLMVSFEGDKQMYFKGADVPCAMVEISLYGDVNAAASDKMTAAVTEILGNELNIAPGFVYVKYDGIHNWGWNGGNF